MFHSALTGCQFPMSGKSSQPAARTPPKTPPQRPTTTPTSDPRKQPDTDPPRPRQPRPRPHPPTPTPPTPHPHHHPPTHHHPHTTTPPPHPDTRRLHPCGPPPLEYGNAKTISESENVERILTNPSSWNLGRIQPATHRRDFNATPQRQKFSRIGFTKGAISATLLALAPPVAAAPPAGAVPVSAPAVAEWNSCGYQPSTNLKLRAGLAGRTAFTSVTDSQDCGSGHP